MHANNHRNYSLGLSSKVSKDYKAKNTDDVIKELEAIDPEEAFSIICSAIKKNHNISAGGLKTFDECLSLDVEFLKASVGKDIYLTGYINVEIMPAGPDLEVFDFIAFTPYFLLNGHFHKVYLDFILPEATIYKTYRWKEIYQNVSSLPYELTRTNVAKIIKAIEDLSNATSEFNSHFTIGSDIDNVLEKILRNYITDDLWEYARKNGALVATDESLKISFQESMKCKPVEILREARKTQTEDVLESLENSIEKLYGVSVNLSKNFSIEENSITISDSKNRIFNTIDMTLVEGWKPYDCDACLEDFNDRILIEETIAKEAAKMIGRKPSNLGLCRRLEERKK